MPLAITEKSDLLEWLRAKLSDAERALSARKQAAECWRSGTDKEWAESAKLHPSTAKAPPLTKAERIASATREERISIRLRRDVENYKSVIAALSHSIIIALALLLQACAQTERPIDEQVIVRGTRDHPTIILSHKQGDDWTNWKGEK